MKLHWVELENWRKHTKTRIDFNENATVIYGPNETGKSTILEALSKGLFDKSSSRAEAIKCVKPLSAPGKKTALTARIISSKNIEGINILLTFSIPLITPI